LDERALLKVVMDVVGRERCLDDCAIFPCGEQLIVATTDMLHKTTDFPEGMTDWQIGWMSAAVTLSDIAAMGATPCILLLAVGLDKPGRLRAILQGARECCLFAGTDIAGGDIDHHDELTLVSSGIGSGDPGHIIRRTGSKPGDLVGVTGTLGRAQAALSGHHEFNKILMEPQPKIREGHILAMNGVTSMMDISDGLSLSLYDLLLANSCGYAIESSAVPAPEGLTTNMAIDMALYGGGDFELLFTIPPEAIHGLDLGYSIIGKVIPEHTVLLDGQVMEKRGYEHRW
jgi:thiamine-monophosphate kinase